MTTTTTTTEPLGTLRAGDWRDDLALERAIRAAVRDSQSQRMAETYGVVFTSGVFQAVQWAEMHPDCFSDEARVRVYALRDLVVATDAAEMGWLPILRAEYDAVLAALRASSAALRAP